LTDTSAIIVVLVICGVGISTLTLGDKPDPPRPTEPKVDEATTRDIGIGTDADYPLIDYEARIDKILDSVPPPEPQRPRKRSKSEPWTDRIERI
jgi:hypothetical protein